MRQFVVFLLTGFLFSFSGPFAVAQNATPTPTCIPVYGGGPTCGHNADVRINKQVRDPKSGKYVDNLTTPYAPGQAVTFHIFVTNPTDKDITGISIQDTFPSYLSYTDGDGKFDFNKQTFTATLTSLTKGQSKAITVTGTVVSADKLPSSPATLCVGNVATATLNGKTSTDTTPFCLSKTAAVQSANTTNGTTRNAQPGGTTKGGLPIYSQAQGTTKKTPDTGPAEMAYLVLFIAALGGLYLRRKTIFVIHTT